MCCECTAGHRCEQAEAPGDLGLHGQGRTRPGFRLAARDGDGGGVRGQHSCVRSCGSVARRSCAVASRRSVYGSDCVRSCGSVGVAIVSTGRAQETLRVAAGALPVRGAVPVRGRGTCGATLHLRCHNTDTTQTQTQAHTQTHT